MSYDECRRKFLSQILKEYEQGKLKLRNDKKVKKKNQAIAIALSMAQRNCKYTQKDLKQVEEKVMMFLKEDKRKISEKKVPLTNVIETKMLIKKYIKNDKKKAKKLYKLLLNRIISAGSKGIKITENIFDELNEINKMIKSIN